MQAILTQDTIISHYHYLADVSSDITHPQHAYILHIENHTGKDLELSSQELLHAGLHVAHKNDEYNWMYKYTPSSIYKSILLSSTLACVLTCAYNCAHWSVHIDTYNENREQLLKLPVMALAEKKDMSELCKQALEIDAQYFELLKSEFCWMLAGLTGAMVNLYLIQDYKTKRDYRKYEKNSSLNDITTITQGAHDILIISANDKLHTKTIILQCKNNNQLQITMQY
jgi:hypothetical protein